MLNAKRYEVVSNTLSYALIQNYLYEQQCDRWLTNTCRNWLTLKMIKCVTMVNINKNKLQRTYAILSSSEFIASTCSWASKEYLAISSRICSTWKYYCKDNARVLLYKFFFNWETFRLKQIKTVEYHRFSRWTVFNCICHTPYLCLVHNDVLDIHFPRDGPIRTKLVVN